MIGRTAEHAEGEIGDMAVPQHAPLQVLARARAQEIDRVAAAVLLVAHNLAVGGIRLHVIERGDSYGRVAKGGVTGNVADPLAADIHDAPVTQRFQVLLACAQHRLLLVSSQNSSMSEPSRNRPVLRLRRASLRRGRRASTPSLSFA